MDLSKLSVSVPDLGQLKHKDDKPLVAVTVKPGDQVMVLLPQQVSQAEVEGVTQMLRQWNPLVNFLVLSGPESITVIPGPPSEDKAPQGQKAFFEQVHEVEQLVAEANRTDDELH